MSELLVFDGDDTLWISEPLYDEARQKARGVVEAAGLDGKRWEELERQIDVRNVERLGLKAERFPTSCVEALEAVVHEQGVRIRREIKSAVWQAAAAVFSLPAARVADAQETLARLKSRYALALLTQGDPQIQRRRVAQSNLEDFFDAISGVETKSAAAFRELLLHFHSSPRSSWSIGNSLPSDINPALSIGMNAIWIAGHVWEYERRETQPHEGHMIIANSLRDVPEILQNQSPNRVASA